MTQRGWRVLFAAVTAFAVAATIVVAAPISSKAAVDYGPGVAMLQDWWDAGTRGDRAGDPALLADAEETAQDVVSKPNVTLDGPAETVFAVGTPTGAVALVVQHATDTRGGQTTIAQGVSLPVAVLAWFDESDAIYKEKEWFPVSAEESATGPNDGGLLAGIWSSAEQRHLVLFDTGYPMQARSGYLKPRYSSEKNLLRRNDLHDVDFGGAGYTAITLGDRVISGSSDLELEQDAPLSNNPFADGTSYDWLPYTHEDFPWDLWFEGHDGASDLRIKPWPAAYENARTARERVRNWIEQRVAWDVNFYGLPLQAKLPGGQRVLFHNVHFSKAYVAFVRFRSDRVVGVRCTTPGTVITASCRLPSRLGRLFVTDDPFRWRVGDHDWQPGHRVSHDYTRAVIVPMRATIRVLPYQGDPFVLYGD